MIQLGLSSALAIALALVAILQCAVATSAGSDRVVNSPQFDPTGARVLAAVSDPTVAALGWVALALAVAGYLAIGVLVGRLGGSPRAAASPVGALAAAGLAAGGAWIARRRAPADASRGGAR